MDRVALFVDAGYLFAQGSRQLTGQAEPVPRKRISLDNEAACEFLRGVAKDTGLDLLRIYWYDGVYAGELNQQQHGLSYCAGVKVRVGVISGAGKQKGVDSLIVTDMITLSRNRAMVSAVLLAGDEDLRVGMQQSQEQGVQVHLLGWTGSQSGLLRQEADSVREITLDELKRIMSIQSPDAAATPPAATRVASGDPFLAVAESVADTLNPLDLMNTAAAAETNPHGFVSRELDRLLLASLCAAMGRAVLQDDERRNLRALFRAVVLRRAGRPTD